MATCAQIEGLAQAYVDGELGVAETASLESHVGQCRTCAHLLERQQATSSMLFTAFSEYRQPRSLVADVMAHLPEMDDARLLRQMNERAKRPMSRARTYITVIAPVLTVVLVVLALALVYSWPDQEAGDTLSIGMVTHRTGTVQSLNVNATKFRTANLRSPIQREQTFETREASSMIASIAGPSTIKLSENARFRVNDDRRVGLQSGKIWLHVSKSANGTRVFRVATPDGNITVFGTTFGVEVLEGRTLVTLLEGEVTVENNVTFATLHPNQQIELKQGVSPLTAYAVDAGKELAWADAIQPDTVAQAEFLTTIHPLGETILRAENVWRVDTDKHHVSSISFEWKPTRAAENICGYVVYVADDSGNPLFVGRIEARDLAQPGRTHIELNVPGDALKPNTTAFIRLVPDTATGSVQTDFTEVAFVGV